MESADNCKGAKMRVLSLPDLGWQPFFEQQISNEERKSHRLARVIAHHGSHVLFLSEQGEQPVPSGIVEQDDGAGQASADGRAAIGDWYLLSRQDDRMIRRLERKTVLSRRAAGATVRPQLIAANVDTVFIVSSCNQEFNLSRLERYLALVFESGSMPLIVLTKADLCDDPAELRQQAEALSPGLMVETLDARDASQVGVLNEWCRTGQTIALLGSSGVGKSTLANALGELDLKTGMIRELDDKGRHTTTSRSMHRLLAGGWLIDNPGMRELQLTSCEQGVADLFEDVIEIAQACRYRNCRHQGDAGCALESAVESGELDARRLKSYLKLQSEQARNATALFERREQERKSGQLYMRVIAEKRNRRRGPG